MGKNKKKNRKRSVSPKKKGQKKDVIDETKTVVEATDEKKESVETIMPGTPSKDTKGDTIKPATGKTPTKDKGSGDKTEDNAVKVVKKVAEVSSGADDDNKTSCDKESTGSSSIDKKDANEDKADDKGSEDKAGSKDATMEDVAPTKQETVAISDETTNKRSKSKKKRKKKKGTKEIANDNDTPMEEPDNTPHQNENEDNETNDNKTDDNKTDDNKTDDNKTDDDTEMEDATTHEESTTNEDPKTGSNKKKTKKKRQRALPEKKPATTTQAPIDPSDSESDTPSNDEPSPTPPTLPSPSSPTPPPPNKISDGRYRNKQRCLTICTRGISARYRHLLEDLRTLLPHHKKESKLDPTSDGGAIRSINDIASIWSCNSVLYMESRRNNDGYMWIGRSPHGPSCQFEVLNVHTMDELRLTGNGLKGSRPVLTFDESFERVEHLKCVKMLLEGVFGTPRGHPKSKPFVDRVMGFYWADDKIWVRHYQIVEESASNAKEAADLKQGGLNTSLVEIGPRFILNPIRIFNCCLFGQTLWANPKYVSPAAARAEMKKRMRQGLNVEEVKKRRMEYRAGIKVPEDPLKDVFQ
mmetsp:Transcript_12664/g.15982  ORF Transcript_12664/g.15982 Transcript_12664/m.15982 type:complete len:582 (+) Transcript_12664:118-1863(+)|eukprot:CAMPEP_0172495168 /NCGR_PEP_ID=MMETSP1066-20121228/64181_1 /TAXON_ID=671091 /ORGANISM="Coscinodiscus wailesii, Strain CCMP2513" /LENGTH=581 /DNA_ID=CAMNT_0013266659 /DNA_START=106 /DNA_END=1851 /DNA_ORIENTATION=+